MQPSMPSPLGGLRVLVVEDEYMVADHIGMLLEDLGCEVAGFAATVAEALDLVRSEQLDGVLLDGNLNGEKIDAVADLLAARDIPFAFVSGYDRDHLPQGHANRPMLGKPFRAADVRAMLHRLAGEAHAVPR